MYLVYQSLNGEKAPPPTLPPELVPPSKRQSSFTLSLPSTGISTNNTVKSVSDDPFGSVSYKFSLKFQLQVYCRFYCESEQFYRFYAAFSFHKTNKAYI